MAIRAHRRHRRRPDGQWYRPCLRPPGYDVRPRRYQRGHARKALQPIDKNMDRQIGKRHDQRRRRMRRSSASLPAPTTKTSPIATWSSRPPPRTKRSSSEIFKELCPHLPPNVLLATNTSSISITRLGRGHRPARQFIGMHFMNPVPVMELVEVIRGIATDDDDLPGRARDRQTLGKTTAMRRTSRPSSSTASCCR